MNEVEAATMDELVAEDKRILHIINEILRRFSVIRYCIPMLESHLKDRQQLIEQLIAEPEQV